MSHADVVVIGGGPAGATSALLLARAGWRVVLIERKRFPRRKVCGEYLSLTNWPLLEELGLAERFAELAGPDVRRVALFVGQTSIGAPLPKSRTGRPWGRALGREHLDTLLVELAQRAGADVRQPWQCDALERLPDGWLCRASSYDATAVDEIETPVVIAAHGSWDVGPLSTQSLRRPPRRSDLFGFKAHFRDSGLEADLMPLLSFPGGYGGLVCSDDNRTSLSCCVRRDRLDQLERKAGCAAGDAVLAHLLETTRALQPVLGSARRLESWLSAGPIRPGIRPRYRQGVFFVGNAAGEAHPVVAEGISMALQSSWLAAQALLPLRDALAPASDPVARRAALEHAGRKYSRSWRRSFAPRIWAAAAVAQWAMRPRQVEATVGVIKVFPSLLTLGARLAGKATKLSSFQEPSRT